MFGCEGVEKHEGEKRGTGREYEELAKMLPWIVERLAGGWKDYSPRLKLLGGEAGVDENGVGFTGGLAY